MDANDELRNPESKTGIGSQQPITTPVRPPWASVGGRLAAHPVKNPMIFLGDLGRAMTELQAGDDRTRRAMAACLGLELESALTGAPAPLPPAPPQPNVSASSLPPTTVSTATGSYLPQATPLPSILQRSLIPAAPLPVVPALARESAVITGPALEPLLQPLWTRGILSAAFATRSADGPLDFDRLIMLLARAALVSSLPRRFRPTLRRGLQLLVDRGEAMSPYAADRAAMQAAILHVVGREKTQVLNFAGYPLPKAGIGPPMRWQPYEPPPPGTPVALVTDLGIGRPPFSAPPASVLQWLAFAVSLRRRGSPVIALVPYAQHRWPAGLSRVMTIIPWDRSTTAAAVAHLVGSGHEV